jgi:hypothetical protein
MATTFYPTPNDTGTATTGYVAGSGTIALAAGAGAMFGVAFPLVVTLSAEDRTSRTVYEVAGRTGDVLTGVLLLSGADVDRPAGSPVEVLWADEHVEQLRDGINGVEAGLLTKAPAVHQHAGGDITSGTVAPARLGSGTPSSANYLRGDGSWQVVASGGGGPANTDALPEGTTNLYYTDARAVAALAPALAGKAPTVHVHAGTDITSGVVAPARLGSGTPSTGNYLRGDGSWQTVTSSLTPPGGANMQVQYNAGGFAGSANLVWDNATSTLTTYNVVIGGTLMTPRVRGVGGSDPAIALDAAAVSVQFPGGTTGSFPVGGGLNLTVTTAANPGLVVKAAASQAGNLTEWRDGTGTILSSVGPGGFLRLGGAAAPSHPLTVNGNCDGLAYGPIYVRGVGTGTIGVAVTLDAGNDTGGKPYSFISTGVNAAGGAGDFSIYQAGYVFRINPAGQMLVGMNAYLAGYQGMLTVLNTSTVGTKGLVVRGLAGQTANLTEWQNSAGASLSAVTAAGVFSGNGSGLTNLNVPAAGATGQVQYCAAGSVRGGAPQVMVYTSGTILRLFSGGAGDKILATVPVAGQAGNQQEWCNSGGGYVSAVDANGFHVMPYVFGVPTYSSADGTILLDIQYNRLYVRSGGVWRYAQLT